MRRWLLKFHRWAGLVLGLWFVLLGATGIILDHPEWRWVWQRTVPETWLSKPVARLLRGTIMRHVVIDAADERHLLGGSERGLWHSVDAGQNWQPVAFADLERAPLVHALVPSAIGSLDGVWIATDDGLWRTAAAGATAQPIALRGRYLNSLSPGAVPHELLAVEDRGAILRIDTRSAETPQRIALDDTTVAGLPATVDLYGIIFDLHFGEAVLQRAKSVVVNDLTGVAMVVLPITGFLFWLLPKRWRHHRLNAAGNARRRSIYAWLYRCHAPIIGTVLLLPLLYLGVTGALLTQTQWLDSWAKDIRVNRDRLLWTYQFASLDHEVKNVVGYADAPQRLSIATRLGVLHSSNGGQSWQRDQTLAASGFNLFRAQNTVFASLQTGDHWYRGDGQERWQPIVGPSTAAFSATRAGDDWVLKNSRGFWRGELAQPLTLSGYKIPPLPGATAFLFVVDLHVGYVFSEYFKWINVLAGIFIVVLVITGPVLWWRVKWR